MKISRLSFAIATALLSTELVAQQSNTNEYENIEEVHVFGRAGQFYFVEESTMATKTPTDYMDLPQSIQVLSQQLINDQAARQTSDLYRSISGVTQFSYSGVTARGFRQDQVRYDGVQGDPYGGFSIPQLFNIERVEVLKGPSGMLYGGGQPGGLLNYVTKKPKFESEHELGIIGGTDSLLGFFGDSTGSINDDDTLAYRVGAFHQNVKPFRNNTDETNTLLSLGLTWAPTSTSKLIFQYDFIDQDLGGHRLRGVPVDDNGNFLTDISYNPNEKTDFQRVRADVFQTTFKGTISDQLSNTTVLRYLTNERTQNYHENRRLQDDGRSMLREFRDQYRSNDEISLTTDFVYTPTWGDIQHTVLIGGDYFDVDAKSKTRIGLGAQSNIPDIDIFNPVYGADPSTYLLIDRANGKTASRRTGIYLQDQVELNDQWQVIAGLRYDNFEEKNIVDGSDYSDSDISPRVGLIYKPSEQMSVFLAQSSGFSPQSLSTINDGEEDPDATGRLDPEQSNQWEFGIKNRWLNDTILTTLTVYQIVKENVTVTNTADTSFDDDSSPAPIPDGEPRVVQIGEVTSKGIELDIVGDISDNWTGTLSYAYNEAKITGGLPDSIGNSVGDEFANAPDHTFGLWTRYDLPIINSAFAIGVDYVSDRISFSNQTVKPYTVWDASWHSEFEGIEVQINIKNLFDKEYATSGFNRRNGHFPGAPRTVLLQVSKSF